MRFFSLFFVCEFFLNILDKSLSITAKIKLISVAVIVILTRAEDDIGEGDCMSLNCDAKEYKPICGGLDVESSIGFVNECALRIYNCQHETGSFSGFVSRQ